MSDASVPLVVFIVGVVILLAIRPIAMSSRTRRSKPTPPPGPEAIKQLADHLGVGILVESVEAGPPARIVATGLLDGGRTTLEGRVPLRTTRGAISRAPRSPGSARTAAISGCGGARSSVAGGRSVPAVTAGRWRWHMRCADQRLSDQIRSENGASFVSWNAPCAKHRLKPQFSTVPPPVGTCDVPAAVEPP